MAQKNSPSTGSQKSPTVGFLQSTEKKWISAVQPYFELGHKKRCIIHVKGVETHRNVLKSMDFNLVDDDFLQKVIEYFKNIDEQFRNAYASVFVAYMIYVTDDINKC